MRWIAIGFIAYCALAFLYALVRDLWRRDGVGVLISAALVIWGCLALHGSI